MKYTLRQLQVFTAIAEIGTVRAAAEQCFITQAAASAALRELEIHLEGPLFSRIGKRLQLNARGQWLIPRAHHLIQEAEALSEGLAQLDEMAGVLAIGASQTIAEHRLPQLLQRYHSRYPQVSLKLEVSNSREVMQHVKEGKLSIGLIEAECRDPELNPRQWQTDELVIVAASQHPLANQTLTMAQLNQQQWLLRESGSGTRAIFEQQMARHGLTPTVAMSINHPKSLLALLESGDYLSCVSRTLVQESLAAKQLVELSLPELMLSRPFNFIALSSNLCQPRVKCFIEQMGS
ncbi:LysR family transcriptional regulator [Corallincola luteus]|uniref:LysR family transcriptional regulator n=1 Tax=Corallincola luteus TaxID=1775177 RepID=A0ABY2ANU7_9GAMM|nr:LysR substrate-binding domain-containing protein [Corallincola luteus]TCI04591.1 LysR family transcriptional regulator [Corallincola luteus]